MVKKIECVGLKNKLDSKDKKYVLENDLDYSSSVKAGMLTKVNECKELFAVDTETFQGICKLITISGIDFKNSTIKNIQWIKPKINHILDPSFDDCLRLLTYHRNVGKKAYRFFWNIDFDIQAILKLVYDDDKKKQLRFINALSKGIPMKYIDHRGVEYELTWIRSKMFKINIVKSHKSVVYTDLYTFYNLGLGKASKQYLKLKKYSDLIDAERLNNDITYWKHKFDIIRYCIRDSDLTVKLGFLLIDSILSENLLLPKILVSPASISKENYRFENNIPSLEQVNIDIVQIAFNSYYGGRFEIFKRGFFKESYLYDIVSEYPNYIRNMPDIQNGIWIRKEGKVRLPKKRPIFSYYKAKLNIPNDNKISTIPIKNKKGIVCFPNGVFEGWYTWFELDLMREYIIEISIAYEYMNSKKTIFKCTNCQKVFKLKNNLCPICKSKIREIRKSNLTFPFKRITEKLFERKSEIDKTKNVMGYNTVKITMNGIYGCTIEKHDKIEYERNDKDELIFDDKDNPIVKSKGLKGGILFNPIYASHITAYGRWRLLKEIPKELWNNIIAFHTDSIITDIDISNHLNIGKRLGQWQMEAKGKGIIINTGMYQVGNVVKTRGIPKKVIGNWLKFCLKNKNLKEKEFKIRHMKKVREAIIQDKSIALMNTMSDINRSVKLNSESKRTWYNDFKTFNDLLNISINSLPLVFKDMNLIPNPNVLVNKLDTNEKIIDLILNDKSLINGKM